MNQNPERLLIGQVMVQPSLWHEVASQVALDDLIDPDCRETYRAMEIVAATGVLPDPLLVMDELARQKSNVNAMGLAIESEGEWRVPHCIGLIRAASTKRRILHACVEITQQVQAGDSPDAILSSARSIFANIDSPKCNDPVKVGDKLSDVLTAIGERKAAPDKGRCFSGIEAFDRVVGGFRDQQLITVAARPGAGKTSLARCVLLSAARAGIHSLMFSLEMSFQEQVEAFLSLQTGVAAHLMSTGSMSDHSFRALYGGAKAVADLPLWIDDKTRRLGSIAGIVRSFRQRYHDKKVLVAVDYGGLVRVDGAYNREDIRMAEIPRVMKELAAELEVPVILMWQLNRDIEKRDERIPRLSDLRECGAVEQDSNMVIFIDRDTKVSGDGPATLIVAKHRGGPVGKVECWWHAQTMTFRDVTDQDSRMSIPYQDSGVI